MSKDKKAKARFNPANKKQPKLSESPSFHGLHPSWRVGRIQTQHPFGCHELTADEWNRLRNHLSSLERQTWEEILIRAKKQNHNVAIDDLSRPAQDRLRQIFDPLDFDDLLSLRLSGRERIWGILDRGAVTLLWWDPNHEVCPSELKHT